MMRFLHPILTAGVLLSLAGLASADMKAERKAAAEAHPRRLIFDNDGNDCLRPDGLTPEGFIRQRTKGMEGTQVTTILYCSNAAFGTTQRPSQVWKRVQWKPPVGDDVPVQKLVESGLDPLGEMVKFGKQHRIEVFATIRMNDIHDHTPKFEGKRAVFYENSFRPIIPNGCWAAANSAQRRHRGPRSTTPSPRCRRACSATHGKLVRTTMSTAWRSTSSAILPSSSARWPASPPGMRNDWP